MVLRCSVNLLTGCLATATAVRTYILRFIFSGACLRARRAFLLRYSVIERNFMIRFNFVSLFLAVIEPGSTGVFTKLNILILLAVIFFTFTGFFITPAVFIVWFTCFVLFLIG